MPDAGIEERVANLEGRVHGFHGRFDSLERRFDGLERRFHGMERRVDELDAKVDRRFEALEAKMASQFWWLLGTQLTVFVTVITVLAGALFVGR